MGIGQNLVIKDVTKHYGDFKALDRIRLDCRAGEFVTILGSSGSGKTTLLKVIAGFEASTHGKIYINGKDVADLKAYERNIGMLFQNYALFPHMTIEQNIAYPLKLRKMPKDEISEKVKQMISMVKLEGMEKRYPKQLSGGQQQRVALARAIVYNPPLLLLDEPLGALDKNLRHDMQFEIKRITSELGMTTISVTHDQEEAFAMSDKICIMSGGRIQQFAEPEVIYEKPANRFVAEFMGTTNIIKIGDAEYKRDGAVTEITGKTGLADGVFKLKTDSKTAKTDVRNMFFALRPESIHLAEDGVKHANEFAVEMKESIYIGDSVKIKGAVKDVILNINLSVKEYRKLKDNKEIRFYFHPEDVAVLYQ